MTKINLMSSAVKEQLKEAVYDMTVLTDDGMHPSSALEKIASDNSFTDDQIRIIGRTYNTAASIEQRKKCASVLDWLETYPLADAEAVLERRNAKKTAEVSVVKVASVWETTLDRKQPLYSVPIKRAYFQQTERQQQQQPKPVVKVPQLTVAEQIKETDIKLAALKPKFDAMASVLRKQIKTMPVDRQEVIKYAAVVKYGDGIRHYFNTVFTNPKTITLPKTASAMLPNDPVVELLGNLKKCAEEIVSNISVLGKLSASAAPKPKVKQAALKDFWQKPSYKSLADAAVNTNTSLIGQSYKTLRDVVDLRSPPETDISSSMLGPQSLSFGIETPFERQKLKKIELQALLNDLRYNDPIISEYDDEKIGEAFNDVFSVAPTISEKPAMLRSMMREYLAKDGLGMYDLHGIIGDEKSMLEAGARRSQAIMQERQFGYNAAQDSYDLNHPKKMQGNTQSQTQTVTVVGPKPDKKDKNSKNDKKDKSKSNKNTKPSAP